MNDSTISIVFDSSKKFSDSRRDLMKILKEDLEKGKFNSEENDPKSFESSDLDDDDSPHNMENSFELGVKRKLSSPFISSEKWRSMKQVKVEKRHMNLPCIKGNLKKKSQNAFGQWKVRICSLDKGIFKYYRKRDLNVPWGVINFFQISVELDTDPNNYRFTITPKNIRKSFRFRSGSKENYDLWVKALKDTIKVTEQYKELKIDANKITNFWKCSIMHETELLKTAQTGDLLLFRSAEHDKKTSLILSKDDFDHMAMIVRYGNDDILLFEASPSAVNPPPITLQKKEEAVILSNWNEFRNNNYHRLYQRITYRGLATQRTNKFINSIGNFINEMLGVKAIRTRKNIQLDPSESGIYCAELIASCYLKLGLLNEEVEPDKLKPDDFSVNSKNAIFDFPSGVKLTEEYLVNFNTV